MIYSKQELLLMNASIAASKLYMCNKRRAAAWDLHLLKVKGC